MINVCNYKDWDPVHYLDVAEMTTAVAIGYDWLYDVLTPLTRQLVVHSIKTKALDLVVEEYINALPVPECTVRNDSWAKRETNWNVVCNTGMVLGALAIEEQEPELARHIIGEAVKYVPNCLKHFAPDGVCYEGPAYWGYTNMYLSLLLKALNDNFGEDFGLSEMEGAESCLVRVLPVKYSILPIPVVRPRRQNLSTFISVRLLISRKRRLFIGMSCRRRYKEEIISDFISFPFPGMIQPLRLQMYYRS